MKRLLLSTIVLIFIESVTYAQLTPFAKYGDSSKVLTVSNGKYQEVFNHDSIVRVGSVVLNIKQRKISHFVLRDTIKSEATLEPEVVSRWLSPDPIAGKYPYLSPYVFAANSPLFFVDPDGRDIVPHVTKSYKEASGRVVIEITFDVKVAVLITASSSLSASSIASGVQTDLAREFNATHYEKAGNVKFIFKAGSIVVRDVSNASEVNKDEHLVVIVDKTTGTATDKNGKASPAVGWARYGAKVSYVQKNSDLHEVVENAVHELGHNFNLKHSWEDELDDTDSGTNAMDYTHQGSDYSPKQLLKIYNDYQSGNLNKGGTTKKLSKDDYSFTGTTQDKPQGHGNSGDTVPLPINETGK